METHPLPTPWLDLPISLTESILERLPLPDYVTFAAVCPKWRSIQQNHRLLRGRHLSIPWLIPFDEEEEPPQEALIPCYSPFEHHRRLRLPLSLPNHRFCASSRGWILLQDKHISEATNAAADTKKKMRRRTRMSRKQRRYSTPPQPHLLFFVLLNPISGRHIHLPPIHLAPLYVDVGYIAAMSPPPNPTVLVVMRYHIFLFRPGKPDWTVLPRPEGVMICKATFCGGNFYCSSDDMSLVVVDPCSDPDPTVDFFRMDTSELPSDRLSLFVSLIVSVESDRELLMAKMFFNLEERYEINGFRLSKADLSRKKWVRVESLGDQALLVDRDSCVLLMANDFGGRRNCVYFSEALLIGFQPLEWIPWKVFDLGTGRMTEWPLPDTLSEYDFSQIKKYTLSWRWIMPSLENVNAEADGAIASSQHLLSMRL